jgi:CRISPR-associated endonuclease/helicase Cas3
MTTSLAQPDYLLYLWAKSPDKGAGGREETLAEHTWSVLEKLAALIRLRPQLPGQIGASRLWHILFWAAFLHDFGKAAKGFQDRLHSKEAPVWKHRHEVLSLAFVDWVTTAFTSDELLWLIAAIVSHHRDAQEIKDLYSPSTKPEEALMAELSAETISNLWHWLSEYPAQWMATLGLSDVGIVFPILPPQDEAVQDVLENGARRIRQALTNYRCWVDDTLFYADETPQHVRTILLRGHLISSDHMASAHVGELPEPQLTNSQRLLEQLKLIAPYPHQLECLAARGSTVLMSPTGSGKTEAALLWAVEQNAPRLYYTLPFQASMNAMEDRLSKDERDEQGNVRREAPFKGQVGLEHSRSALAHYRRFMLEQDDSDPRLATQHAARMKDLARLNYYPVRVLSPYQLLKAPYRLKGYETLLTDCHSAAFIFDEVHAYEAGRLAKILALVKYLRENYNAKFLVMSATLPELLRERLRDALGEYRLVPASEKLYQAFRRHALVLKDGDLLTEANLNRVAEAAKSGQAVLVCCNTVNRAQQAWEWLKAELASKVKVELLHSRFNGKDRLDKENLVRAKTGSRSTQREAIVLVATQVVEVSLDIDLDVIYTDPAPLEALLQRFGRVNRRRLKECAPVCVFREPVPEKERPYKPELIRAALDVLEKHEGMLIDEAQVSQWLDEAYARPEVRDPWESDYRKASAEFTDNIIANLRAFQSDDELEKLFYQAFESLDVIPEDKFNDYLSAREQSIYEAIQLFVPIRYDWYGRLAREGRAYEYVTEKKDKLYVVRAHYDSDIGLDLSRDSRNPIEGDW